MICRKLRLQPGDRFLDIGCGWGALVCHAALHYGVTPSASRSRRSRRSSRARRPQALGIAGPRHHRLAGLPLARRRVRQDRLDRHVRACRDRQPPRLFRRREPAAGTGRPLSASRHLAPRQGLRQGFRKMRAEYEALTRYIFPGGELDHLGMSIANLERAKFEIHDVEGWRRHYARTTRMWWERLHAEPCGVRGRGRARENPAMASLSRRLLTGLRARRRRHLPDARPEAGQGR